jgi:hypothetical protein
MTELPSLPGRVSPLSERQISARLERPSIRYGEQFAVVGRVFLGRPGVALVLQFRRRPGGTWTGVASTTTGPEGVYRFVARAVRSGAFRVVVKDAAVAREMGSASAPHHLRVDPVLLAAGSRRLARRARRGLLGGRLLGAGAGKRVVLQRRKRGRWSTVAHTNTQDGGAFQLRFTPLTVLGRQLRIRFPGDKALDDAQAILALGRLGPVRLAPGANRPGVALSAALVRFTALMAAVVGDALVITCGTNHSYYTVSGHVSDHASGNAADFGLSQNGGNGDRIAAAALIVAGVPPWRAYAMARRGGAFVVRSAGMRLQVIWKIGGMYGNHFDHVHVGLRSG